MNQGVAMPNVAPAPYVRHRPELTLLYHVIEHHLSEFTERAIETHLIKKAGLTRASGARSGAVTFIQRFGSALNLNVHLHMLIPDGVYALRHGKPLFHALPAPSLSELTALLNRIVRRITRQLTRAGLLVEQADQPYLDLQIDDAIDQFGAASLAYRVILGANAGSRLLTLRNPLSSTPASTKPFTAARDGFSLNAAVACQAHQRDKLERLCRYVARPPLALERLSVTDEGKLRYALKHPYSNGTTHFLFEPLDLLARLAALVPRPRVNLTRYHGVFAPNSKSRARLVPAKPRSKRTRKPDASNQPASPRQPESQPELSDSPRLTWAQRLKRAFEFDVTICPLCGGTLRIIADITDPAVIDKILSHIRQSRAPPAHARRLKTSAGQKHHNNHPA